MDFGPEVTSSDKSVKVLLNAQDKVSPAHVPWWQWVTLALREGAEQERSRWAWGAGVGGSGVQELRCSLQVFSQIRNEHFSSVFGFLSQKSRNLQAQYDVSPTRLRGHPRCLPPQPPHCHDALLQRRRGMDIKQMKNFVSQELKGLKQEHRLLSLRRCWGSGGVAGHCQPAGGGGRGQRV